MSEIKVNSQLLGLKDVKVHVDDYGGTGRPVVLIHGWPLSGKSWKDQIEPLQNAGYRVITYDRRGFGDSDKPSSGYDYDTFAEDLHGLLEALELTDVTLVGFSMGGGEVARYIAKYGEDKIHSVVFAAAIPPMMFQSDDNPDGPLYPERAEMLTDQFKKDLDGFYEQFTKEFFSTNGDAEHILATEDQRQEALQLSHQSNRNAAFESMQAFAQTDFREDLPLISVPTLVLHGDSDGTVPFKGSGKRTHEAIPHSELHVIEGGPHGINVTHASEFNQQLITFLQK